MKIFAKEINNNFYQLKRLNSSNKLSPIYLNMEGAYFPHGMEEYNGTHLINVDLNVKKHKRAIEKIRSIEEKLKDLDFIDNMLEMNFQYKSPLKFINEKTFSARCKIKEMRNKVVTSCHKKYGKFKEATIFDIQKNNRADCAVEVSGVWIYGSTFGLTLHFKNIVIDNPDDK